MSSFDIAKELTCADELEDAAEDLNYAELGGRLVECREAAGEFLDYAIACERRAADLVAERFHITEDQHGPFVTTRGPTR